MGESEYDLEKSLIWRKIGIIADPAPPWLNIEKYLDEEQQKQILARELDLRIKIMENRLETLKLTSQMLKRKA